jgi:hypothetical protein
MRDRGILYWKREKFDGVPTHHDLGRSWVIESDGNERMINAGDLITKVEAERLAIAGDYIFDAEP